MGKKEKIGLFVVFVLVIGAAIAFRLEYGRFDTNEAEQAGTVLEALQENEQVNEIEVTPTPVAPEDIAMSKIDENLKTYTHQKPTFSLDFPADLTIEKYDEGGVSETILFSGPSGSFQVFVSPYSGDGTISEQEVKRLQPLTPMEGVETIKIANTPALLFWSTVPDIGKTREVWLSKGGYLFSVTARGSADAWLAHIMTTWRFE